MGWEKGAGGAGAGAVVVVIVVFFAAFLTRGFRLPAAAAEAARYCRIDSGRVERRVVGVGVSGGGEVEAGEERESDIMKMSNLRVSEVR